VAGVNRNQAFALWRAKTAAILAIDHYTPGKDHGVAFFRDGHRQLLPMQQVFANRMAPAHMPPLIAKGVVLEEQVILPMEVHQAVRIIGPIVLRREVYLWSIRLVVSRGLSVCPCA